jgi:hypothetical protein
MKIGQFLMQSKIIVCVFLMTVTGIKACLGATCFFFFIIIIIFIILQKHVLIVFFFELKFYSSFIQLFLILSQIF